jgi:purine-binding chemotaxis protein CheW
LYERGCVNLSACQVVVFTLGVEEYAINISYAQEIIRVPQLTKVPSTPEFVEGVFNLRGKVIPVIDLKKRFGLSQSVRSDENRLLVLDLEGMKLGFIVDDVSEVIKIDEDTIQVLDDEIVGISKNDIRGISIIDKRIIMMLDAVKLKTDLFK